MPAICIVTSLQPCRNPRVVKECAALASAGYEVTVLGPLLSDELATQDAELMSAANSSYRVSVDLRGAHSRISPLVLRAKHRLGMTAARLFSWNVSDSLGLGPSKTLSIAKGMKADLYISHLELGSWVGCQLAKQGRRVGADFEDWYSRDLLPADQAFRPLRLLEQCERFLLTNGTHITTTSMAMAEALANAYGSSKPTVIYNCFPWRDRVNLDSQRKDRPDRSKPSLHWVSQTIGKGRGLEMLCQALQGVDTPVAVHLRGACSAAAEQWLEDLFPKHQGHTLHLHGLVPVRELISRVAEHDIGLALEPKTPANKNLTASNKIFLYLLAGLAVVATDTAGKKEVASAAPSAVTMYRSGDPASLAEQLNNLLNDPKRLARAKAAALVAAETRFPWERQARILQESVGNALRI